MPLSFSKIFTIGLMVLFSALGFYGSMFTSYFHGFFDAVKTCIYSPSAEECILDMSHCPSSSPRPFTGIPLIDGEIGLLLEFFAQGVKGGAQGFDLNAFLTFTYMAAQFGGAWSLIALEGLRFRSSGTLLSWLVFLLGRWYALWMCIAET